MSCIYRISTGKISNSKNYVGMWRKNLKIMLRRKKSKTETTPHDGTLSSDKEAKGRASFYKRRALQTKNRGKERNNISRCILFQRLSVGKMKIQKGGKLD